MGKGWKMEKGKKSRTGKKEEGKGLSKAQRVKMEETCNIEIREGKKEMKKGINETEE